MTPPDRNHPDLVILGNVNVDLIMGPLAQWPAEGEEVLVPELRWRVGGNAGNAALACHALGTDALTITSVGDDLAGTWLRTQLTGHAVHWLGSATPTSVTAAFSHPGSDRSFVTYLGHLQHLSWPDLAPHLPPARAALLAGAFLTPRLRQDYPALLARLNTQGTAAALDFGWPDGGFTPDIRAEILGWLPGVQHLLINELEAAHLTGAATPQAAAQHLAAHLHPHGTVVIKCGARGVVAHHAGREYATPAPTVQVIDSVGAGDTWNAVYLHGVLRGATLDEALQDAVQVASRAISTEPRQFR
ncbi:carbohydrate kinase family protein [Deinococcus sp. A31D244]|uniref:carbohydrate kinase family protein n=1 Tax=Deinococcus sp. A31D244 TaxID=3397675 RepID=UPI0039E06BB6